MPTYHVTLTFTEPLLGTAPLNKEIYSEYIASRAEDSDFGDEEVETIEETIEKGTTGFHRLEGSPIVYDYVIKGLFKDACGMLRRVAGTGSSKEKAYKKMIDGLIFVKPRMIPLQMKGDISILERPLRAQTAQGERVALARSEMAPAGSKLTFKVIVMDGISESLLREWLNYGELRGLGQWRNGGYGTFTYEMQPA